MDFNNAASAAHFLRKKGFAGAETGVILGTGLSGLAKAIDNCIEIPYQEIPGFPLSTVETHSGKLLTGTLNGHRIIAMQGRFHHYEGYDFTKIVFPVRVFGHLGVKRLLISNAAGSLNPAIGKGELMLIDDHINLQPGNPLIGPNEDRWGARFPDMSRPYDPKLIKLAQECGRNAGITLHSGVYASVPGPNLETRAEYRFLRTIGADAVGMSTVPEVIAAHHMGIRCLAVSVITDTCDPDNLQPCSLEEIIEAAGMAEPSLNKLFQLIARKLEESTLSV